MRSLSSSLLFFGGGGARYTAELGVVIADLRVGGKSHGPHAFHMRLRDDAGELCDGIRVEDMGTKTVANDLDNARVWFDQVELPRDALLNKVGRMDWSSPPWPWCPPSAGPLTSRVSSATTRALH